MPYNPGIQDISGQLLGRGMEALGAGVGRGLDAHKKEQNILKEAAGRGKALSATLKGLEDLGIAPVGSVERITKAQEELSPRAFLAFADQTSQQLGAVIQGGFHMQQLEAKRQQAAAKQEDDNKLLQAIKAATTTEGAIIPQDVAAAYVELGGRDQKKLGDALKAISSAQPKEQFKASGYAVDLPDGTKKNVVQTSNSAVRVLDDPQDTAAMKNLDNRTAKYADIRKLASEGNLDKAHDLAMALGLKTDLGGPITKQELAALYGAEAGKAPAVTPVSAPSVEEKTIGGVVYKRTKDGWVKK